MTGATLRMLQWWCEVGLVSPLKGRGRVSRRWRAEEVERIRLILALQRRGVSLKRFRALQMAPVSGRYGLVSRGEVVWCEDEAAVVKAALESAGSCHLIDVADLRKGLDDGRERT